MHRRFPRSRQIRAVITRRGVPFIRDRSRRTLGWGLVDQGLLSATNVAGSVFAARLLSPEDFGAFSVGFAAYLILLGLARSIANDPLIIRFSAAPPQQQRAAIRDAAGSALAFGVLCSLVLLTSGRLIDGSVGSVLIALSLFVPCLTIQDLFRFALVMQNLQRSAAAGESLWLLSVVAAFALLEIGEPSPGAALAAWAAGSCGAALYAAWRLRLLPTLRVRDWWQAHRDLSLRYSAESILSAGVPYLLMFAVAIVGGLEQTAAFRGGQVVMGPLHVVFSGLVIQLVPMMVRARSSGTDDFLRLAHKTTTLTIAFVLLWTSSIALLPDSAGRALLGDTWGSTSPLLPGFAWLYVALAATIGATSGLRALGDSKTSLSIRLALSPITIVFGTAGVVSAGAGGLVVGLAIAGSLGVGLWWRGLHRSCRRTVVAP